MADTVPNRREETAALTELKNEVIEVHNQIKQLCDSNARLKKLYKGCTIYISPLYFNPGILFLGINPGDGYYLKKKEIIQRFEPLEKQDTGYGLWKELERCCANINKKHLLDDMVKTNCYFFATHNGRELDMFFNLLPDGFRREVLQKSDKWIKTIVKETAPKLVICGGVRAFEHFKHVYPEHLSLENGKYTKIIRVDTMTAIGVRRLFSKIMHKKDFITYLDKYTG
jgi:hypothetical protein